MLLDLRVVVGAPGSEVAAHIVPIWKRLFQPASTEADHNKPFVVAAEDPGQVNSAAS